MPLGILLIRSFGVGWRVRMAFIQRDSENAPTVKGRKEIKTSDTKGRLNQGKNWKQRDR